MLILIYIIFFLGMIAIYHSNSQFVEEPIILKLNLLNSALFFQIFPLFVIFSRDYPSLSLCLFHFKGSAKDFIQYLTLIDNYLTK